MPRPHWKGNFFNSLVYEEIAELDREDLLSEIEDFSFRILRRNTTFSNSSKVFFANKSFEIYNGYDFIEKKMSSDILNYNLGILVSTRETNVVHKAKQTKHQKRNAAQGLKKKLINVSKTKTKIKQKKKSK